MKIAHTNLNFNNSRKIPVNIQAGAVSNVQKTDSFNPSFGRRKIPRFLYHLTTAKNYQSMLREGVIKPSAEDPLKGVFMVELKNLFKNWNACGMEKNLKGRLLQYVSQNEPNIVLLRVPTEKLQRSNLVVRSQKSFFNPYTIMRLALAIDEWKNLGKFSDKRVEKLILGEPAQMAIHMNQKKIPFEYAYTRGIDIVQVQKIGEASINLSDFNPRKIFEQLFGNNLEKKAMSPFND